MSNQPDVAFANSVTKWVVLGGVLILGLAAWGISTGIIRTRAATEVATKWFGHLSAGRYADAHGMLAEDLRSQLTPETLESAVSTQPALQTFHAVSCRDYTQSQEVGKYQGHLLDEANQKTKIFLELRREEAGSETRLAVTGLTIEEIRVLPVSTPR